MEAVINRIKVIYPLTCKSYAAYLNYFHLPSC